MSSTALATPIEAAAIRAALAEAQVSHVVTVPDTNQRTVLELLNEDDEIEVLRAASEDDVLGICAGLWIAGARPVALIQQLGIFASVNALRGITYDLKIPLSILAGLYGREVDRAVHESGKSAVRLCLPLLEALGIDAVLIENPEDAPTIAATLAKPLDDRGTRVVLLGAPTA